METQTQIAMECFFDWYDDRAPYAKMKLQTNIIDMKPFAPEISDIDRSFVGRFMVKIWPFINWEEIRLEFLKRFHAGEIQDMRGIR